MNATVARIARGAVVAALGVAALAGCATTTAGAPTAPTAAPTAAPTTVRAAPATPAAAPVWNADELNQMTFLIVVKGRVSGVSDEMLLRAGHIACANLDKYPSQAGKVGTVIGIAANVGITSEQAAFLTGSAVAAFCPRHNDLM